MVAFFTVSLIPRQRFRLTELLLRNIVVYYFDKQTINHNLIRIVMLSLPGNLLTFLVAFITAYTFTKHRTFANKTPFNHCQTIAFQ